MPNLSNFSVFKTVTLLTVCVSIFSFNLPIISVNASTGPEFIIVTHPNGVNIRDKDCRIVDQANYGQVLSYNINENFNERGFFCNVNGEKLVRVAYGTGKTNMFVAYKYTQMVNSAGWGGEYTAQNKVSLFSPNSGVNLRNEKC